MCDTDPDLDRGTALPYGPEQIVVRAIVADGEHEGRPRGLRQDVPRVVAPLDPAARTSTTGVGRCVR